MTCDMCGKDMLWTRGTDMTGANVPPHWRCFNCGNVGDESPMAGMEVLSATERARLTVAQALKEEIEDLRRNLAERDSHIDRLMGVIEKLLDVALRPSAPSPPLGRDDPTGERWRRTMEEQREFSEEVAACIASQQEDPSDTAEMVCSSMAREPVRKPSTGECPESDTLTIRIPPGFSGSIHTDREGGLTFRGFRNNFPEAVPAVSLVPPAAPCRSGPTLAEAAVEILNQIVMKRKLPDGTLVGDVFWQHWELGHGVIMATINGVGYRICNTKDEEGRDHFLVEEASGGIFRSHERTWEMEEMLESHLAAGDTPSSPSPSGPSPDEIALEILKEIVRERMLPDGTSLDAAQWIGPPSEGRILILPPQGSHRIKFYPEGPTHWVVTVGHGTGGRQSYRISEMESMMRDEWLGRITASRAKV